MKTNYIKLILACSSIVIMASCRQNDYVMDYETELPQHTSPMPIEFGNYVETMTRASRARGNSFLVGDSMEVYGYMRTGQIVDILFNKQAVINTGELIWDYTPKKFWNVGSEYEFYAIFPYMENNSFDFEKKTFSVSDFEVKRDVSAQTDIMIAQRVMNASSNNVVNFVFNHMLSNISFYLKTASQFDTEGISSVQVVSFDVKGIYSKGSFTQTGWNINNSSFTGEWKPDVTSIYDLPKVEGKIYNTGDDAIVLCKDELLMPQPINPDATIEITYKLIYEDGTTTTFTSSTKLGKIVGRNGQRSTVLKTWEPNYRYIYTIGIDPSKKIVRPNTKDNNDQPGYSGDDADTSPNVNILRYDHDGDGLIDEWWIDEDLDGNPDYPIVWVDLDNDGKEEGIPDRDWNGVPDDTDGNGIPDVIWIDVDGDGDVDTELERDVITGSVEIEVPAAEEEPTTIEFSAEVERWADEYESDYILLNNN